jgi:hypothetical protein
MKCDEWAYNGSDRCRGSSGPGVVHEAKTSATRKPRLVFPADPSGLNGEDFFGSVLPKLYENMIPKQAVYCQWEEKMI